MLGIYVSRACAISNVYALDIECNISWDLLGVLLRIWRRQCRKTCGRRSWGWRPRRTIRRMGVPMSPTPHPTQLQPSPPTPHTHSSWSSLELWDARSMCSALNISRLSPFVHNATMFGRRSVIFEGLMRSAGRAGLIMMAYLNTWLIYLCGYTEFTSKRGNSIATTYS